MATSPLGWRTRSWKGSPCGALNNLELPVQELGGGPTMLTYLIFAPRAGSALVHPDVHTGQRDWNEKAGTSLT
jgi:hypothetical protein